MSYILDLDPPERAEVFEAAEADRVMVISGVRGDRRMAYPVD